MSKIIKQKQNNSKALEVRMEEISTSKYQVVLAGMTIHHPQTCARGTCEGHFMFTDNLTYRISPYNTVEDALAEYEAVKHQYID